MPHNTGVRKKMSGSESKTYLVSITLGTEEGELPDNGVIEELIFAQMGASGVLQDTVEGLSCLAVEVMEPKLPKNSDEFINYMLGAFPKAEWDADNDGQIVVYTNLRLRNDGSVVEFPEGEKF